MQCTGNTDYRAIYQTNHEIMLMSEFLILNRPMFSVDASKKDGDPVALNFFRRPLLLIRQRIMKTIG